MKLSDVCVSDSFRYGGVEFLRCEAAWPVEARVMTTSPPYILAVNLDSGEIVSLLASESVDSP